MGYLSAASMESFGRAYPLLSRLHILHEIEQSNELIYSKCGFESVIKFWDERFNFTAPSITQRSLLLVHFHLIFSSD